MMSDIQFWRLVSMRGVAQYAYYVEANPIMSDAKYDRWEKILWDAVDQHRDYLTTYCVPTDLLYNQLIKPGSSNPNDYTTYQISVYHKLSRHKKT